MQKEKSLDWVYACNLQDIVPSTGACALVNNKQVAIFRLENDALYAIDNFDPFSQANVLYRGITGDLKGKTVVASPIYKQHFGLETGVCLEKPEVIIQCFQVKQEGHEVWVSTTKA